MSDGHEKRVKSDQLRSELGPYIQRYIHGERRAVTFHDMILADIWNLSRRRGELSLLDIGCGDGFDNDPHLQRSLAQASGRYIGVEPDKKIQISDIFSTIHRCRFEDAPIDPESIDIAFAVMVLEHIENPDFFWKKIHGILRPGGIFWGFTVDARHWFVMASLLTGKLRIKNRYLNMLHGKSGNLRYENYGVFYRSNTPQQIEKFTGDFAHRDILNLHRVGQLDYYMPKGLRWLGRTFDRVAIPMNWPASVMAVRTVK